MISALDIAAPLIALSEGLRLQAYQDSGGVWTIGIGETGPEVKAGLTITPDQAWGMLGLRMAHLFEAVKDRPPMEAAALVDFGYNCGAGALAAVLAGRGSIEDPKHTTDRHGNVLGGLVSRRRLESMLIKASREGA